MMKGDDEMKVHEGVSGRSIGKRDSWGYGSSTTLYSWPTLGIGPKIVNGSTGGITYPVDGIVHDVNGPYEGLTLRWCGDVDYCIEHRRYILLPDGRCLVPTTCYDFAEFTSEKEVREYLKMPPEYARLASAFDGSYYEY